MSNTNAVFKVADQILARLFDQRQFTTGEVNFLAKELGERCDSAGAFDRILNLNQNTCLIVDSYNEQMCATSDTSSKNINEHLSSLLEKADKILRLEKEFREKDEKFFEPIRRELEQKKQQQAAREQESKLERLRESLSQEESDLERNYLELEGSLRGSKNK